MLSIEEIRALGEMDPDFEPIMKSGSPMVRGWTHDTDIQMIRGIIAQMRKKMQKPDPSTLAHTEEDIQIPIRDGSTLTARVYRPRDAPADGCPGFIDFHGGGFMVADVETEAWLCELFTTYGGIAVNVLYRHAPEFPFPTPIHDSFDATKWTAENAKSLGINPEKGLLIGGESAGADISLVVSHLCRDENMSPPLTGVYAPITSGVNEETVPEKYKDIFFSKVQNAQAPMITLESLEFIYKNYQPDPKSPLAVPVAFPDHSGIPKTYFAACGLDPVRDCSLVLERVYQDAGVPTKLDVYPGLPHGFWAIFPQLSQCKKHDTDTKAALEWLLAN